MKSGSRNFSNFRARNKGQSIRTPDIVGSELEKSTQMYDNAFTVNSEDAYLYKFIRTGRKCSHLEWAATSDEDFPDDDDFEAPVIILDEEEDDEEILDATLEMLQEPKDICPLCYGTGIVGNYKIINSYEVYLDSTFEGIISKTKLEVEAGKPFYFRPIADNSSIVFRVNLPAYFWEFSHLTAITKADRSHVPLDESLVKIGHVGGTREPLAGLDLGDFLKTDPRVELEFAVREDTHGFFLRFLNGKCTIRINFPHIAEEVEEGEYDFFDSVTTSVDSRESISTKDIVKELHYNRFWKVTSVEKKTGQYQDLGKDIGLRKVRDFERFALLP